MADAQLFLQALLAAREAAEMLFHTVTAIEAEAVAIRLNEISLYPIHHLRKQLSKTEQSGLSK
jgi:hypothetical protein